ncbi:MAG: HAD family phosphatase [Pseudomonadota bacterium]
MQIPQNPLIIFDCDGVLIDSEAIYLAEEFAFLQRAGVTVDRDWYIDNFMALALPLWKQKFIGLIEEQTGKPPSEAEFDAFAVASQKRVLEEASVIDGAKDLLGQLDCPVCVASSTGAKSLPIKLKRAGLSDFFGTSVFSGDLVGNGKPAPDLFLHAARTMGFEWANCIVIEDSPNGVRAGKSAGMFTIGFLGGGHAGISAIRRLRNAGADHVVIDHGDLQTWLATNTRVLSTS